MSVVIHFAGLASNEAIGKLAGAVALVRPVLECSAGYERAELLVNPTEGQAQVLLFWRSFEEAKQFLQTSRNEIVLPFSGLIKKTRGPFVFSIEGSAPSSN